jgi:hypothetical protein
MTEEEQGRVELILGQNDVAIEYDEAEMVEENGAEDDLKSNTTVPSSSQRVGLAFRLMKKSNWYSHLFYI